MAVTKADCKVEGVSAPSTVAEVLTIAADILEAEPWCRSDMGTFCGPKCADGAIVAAVGVKVFKPGQYLGDTSRLGGNKRFRLYQDALQAVADDINGPRQPWDLPFHSAAWDVQTFNDDQRDKRKVIRLFRRVARNLRKGGE